tara:strand:- start:571 stop:1473 length:903 start_codon:yes stop_codon:yes gene_type:complete
VINLSNNKNLKNIVIDGASGQVGLRLAKLFYEHGFYIYLITRNKDLRSQHPFLMNSNIEIFNSYEDLKIINDGLKLFIHNASATPSNTNFNYSKLFIENIKISNKLTKHLLFSNYDLVINLSSASVYGDVSLNYLNQNSLTVPNDNYGLSKLFAEEAINLVTELNKKLKCIHFRLPGIIYKGSESIFISKLINKIKAGNKIIIKEKKSKFNNATCINDIGNSIIKISEISKLVKNKSIINFHSEKEIYILEMIKHISMKLKVPFPKVEYDSNIRNNLISNLENKSFIVSSNIYEMIEEIL